MKAILAILVLVVPLFAEYKMRGETQPQDSTLQRQSDSSAIKKRDEIKNNVDSMLQKRQVSTQNPQKNAESSAKKRPDSNKNAESSTKNTTKKQQPKQTIKTQRKSTKKSTVQTTKKDKPNESTKRLGYRNVTISNINKQTLQGINFFVGANLGIDFITMEHIIEDEDGKKTSKKSSNASASFGLKGGILSEEDYVGGRFYGEFSYLKIPKFHVVNVGLDLDLMFNYYKTDTWRIGGFLGLGGGMNVAMIADNELQNAGKKSLIAIGWVNIGLARFVYGPHSAEFNVRIQYVTPTIYSLKDKTTSITTTYKASSNTILLSYAFDF